MVDVLIIGGGPGGYAAAIRTAQLKGKVALIEDEYLQGIFADFTIPNVEVKLFYESTIRTWFNPSSIAKAYTEMLSQLIKGDAITFKKIFQSRLCLLQFNYCRTKSFYLFSQC